MVRHRKLFLALAVLLFISLFSISSPAQSLKTIDPPGGGKIMYGQVAGQSTEAGAMAYILHNLHQNLGDKPQVGKLFQVRNTQSVATFFSITRHDQVSAQGQGKAPLHIAGLIIATKVSTDHVEAALVSDDASRFNKTLPSMMKTLFASWHPLQGGGSSASSGSSAPAAPLHQVALQDRSAAVSLPDGWQIAQQMSGGGTIVASGPNGEAAELGLAWLVGDTNNPQTQRILAQLRAGYLRNTIYSQGVYYPFGADPGKTFEYLIQSVRKKANLAPAKYNFAGITPVNAQGARCAHLTGTTDLADGKGLHEFNALFCEQQPNSSGTYLTNVTMTSVPTARAAQERATLGAILQSFQVNQAVVQQQANAIAAPVIAQIHAIGEAATARINAVHQAEDIHNSSVYSRWDSQDKRSQEFENYQLGYSVISTTDNTAHGTFWNEDADALVKSHPDKFEYVNAPNYWKGIDY